MPTFTLMGAVGELAASPHGVFSRSQAVSLGVSTRNLVQLVVERVITEAAPGVYLAGGSIPTWRQRLRVATLCCNESGVAAFQSSAQLHGADGFADDTVAVLLPAPRKLRVADVEVHVGPMDAIDLTTVDGIRCTTLERTLCDLGSTSSPQRVKLAFEWYWRHHLDLSVLQHTVDRLHRRGQRGTKVLQQLLAEADAHGRPAESALEVRLEAVIGDLEGLVRQHEVFDEMGRFVARTDFAIPARRLAFEAHSVEFHSDRAAVERDTARHRRLTAAGWRVRYVTAAEMADPDQLYADIARLLRSDESPTLPVWPDPA